MSRYILAQLTDAESALRENLHRHDLDPNYQRQIEEAAALKFLKDLIPHNCSRSVTACRGSGSSSPWP